MAPLAGKGKEIQPLRSLEEVLRWEPDKKLLFRTEPLGPRVRDETGPKLLVCHDMQGGYLEDRFIDGSDKCDGYRFFHWHYVDIFVYFSHHLVTIPPVGWINAAHRHGVKVLGTLITEWDQGYETCKLLLGYTEKSSTFVKKLTEICKHFRFDGWLVNIENRLESDQVVEMEKLVRSLKQSMEDEVPNSQVIWYDSVIHTGELKWQNELNTLNRNFFDASHGIFLNYNWDEGSLERSLTLAGKNKAHNVYVGVDVFGRGCLGGGGFNTSQALEVVNRFSLSVALFAPGWVLEVHGWDDFLHNQHKFWDLIGEFFRGSKYCRLPICTSFCQGYGQKTYSKGHCVSESPWYDLSAQQLQPAFQSEENLQVQNFTKDAFEGGGCLNVTGTLPSFVHYRDINLLKTEIDVTSSWLVTLTWKPLGEERPDLGLRMIFKDTQGQKLVCLLACSSQLDEVPSDRLLHAVTPEQVDKHGLTVENDDSSTWITTYFILDEKDFTQHLMTKIGVRISRRTNVTAKTPMPFSLLLGHIQVVQLSDAKSAKCKCTRT